MPFGISIKATGADATPIYELWEQFGRFETEPSMGSLNYPPHITLAVCDNVSEERLRTALRTAFHPHPRIRLRFAKLAFFEQPQLVFWAAPDVSESLVLAHTAVHDALGQDALGSSRCREHYRPGNWIPHCTLATGVPPSQAERAKAVACAAIEPFEVVFDVADCVEFPPVRIIDEVPLDA